MGLVAFQEEEKRVSLAVKTSPSNSWDVGLNPGCGTKIPHALWQNK